MATYWNGDVRQGAALAEEMLQVCRANGDRFDEAELLDGPLSAVAFTQGNYARAAALHEQSLALRCALHDTDGEAWSLFLLARSVSALGDMERSRTLYEESRALWRQLGNWREYANVLDELGRLACRRGDNSLARALFEESLTTAQSIYDRYRMARALCALGMVACGEGDFTQAQASLKQMTASVRELQDTPLPTMFFLAAARLASTTGPSERAARLAGAAETALSKTEPYQGTSDRFEYEAVLASIRLALSEEVFDRARAEGRAMSLNAALACATDEALS
jgi:tetratricopeptide (TPR) repeat protein